MDEITPGELRARLERREPLVLLDVRQEWETKLCRLEGATHIPIEEIEYRTEELRLLCGHPERPEAGAVEIIVFCHQGIRSAAVSEYLRQLGFPKVKNLAGGLDGWARTVDPTMRRY